MYPYTPPPGPTLPPPPPAPKKRSPVVVILAVCVALLIAFVLVMLLGAATVLTSSSKSTTTAGGTPTTAPNGMPAFEARVAPLLSALQADMRNITSAANDTDVTSLRSACRSLDTNSGRLRAALPSPDPELTAELSSAVDDFEASAAYCVRGSATLNTTDLREAGDRISSGADHVAEAAQILDRY